MICAIHQPQYLPWLGYFDKMASADVFVLLDNVQFKKNEWQNRNRIRTSQGWQWVTVPVLHDSGQLISEVKINAQVNWRAQHIRSIELNYARAPYFLEYWPRILPLYEQKWSSLGELNLEQVKLFASLLGIATPLLTSSGLNVMSEKTQRLAEICRAVGADTYLAGKGCSDYMDFGLFAASGIEVRVQEYHHPFYPQLWCRDAKDFMPGMSILDLLMNCGPRSLNVLRGII